MGGSKKFQNIHDVHIGKIEKKEKKEEFDDSKTKGKFHFSQQSSELIDENTKIDWTRMFRPGACPQNIEGMKGLTPEKLSGEWYLQETSTFMMEGMTPSCHHAEL